MSITAIGVEVRRASEWLETACRGHEVPQAVVDRLMLCLNEVLANVIIHGGESARSAPIRLVLEVALDQGQGKAGVTVSDAGTAFDPRSVPARSLPRTLEEASVGGRGLVLIRRCSDWLDYHHEGGRNHLTFGACWEPR
ncbi:MAG TPA: ATP-binding protein [Usitatibacter sp.]|nr:ATP-binding protein [Usitatibacter sp.]